MAKETPCDYGECPYDAMYSEHCRVYCGLGADEDSYDEEEKVMKLCVEGPHMEKYEDRKLKELTEKMINSYKK